MDSRIAAELQLEYQPVATIFTDEKPAHALQFAEGSRGCVISMLTAAAKGQTAVFDRATTGCTGAVSGPCFGEAYSSFPGGFEYLLSTGRGEGYKKSPALVRDFMSRQTFVDLPDTYRVFRPLGDVNPAVERPTLITFREASWNGRHGGR